MRRHLTLIATQGTNQIAVNCYGINSGTGTRRPVSFLGYDMTGILTGT